MRTLVKVSIAIALAFSVMTASYAAGYGTHWWLNNQDSPATEEADQFTVFWEAWHILEKDFYGQLPTAQQMTYGAIRGVLTTLDDPYTAFVEPKPRRLEKDDLRGSFGGIGAWVSKREDGAIVLKPMEDKPAQRAGILEGDVVIQVDDQEITPDMSLEDVILLIRGPVGTVVKLTISRAGYPEPLVFEITREKVETPTVAWRLLDEDGLGYVSISLFTERTDKELETALQDLKAQGATRLILDLRNNSGGLLQTAIDVASQFLPDGVVLYEQRRDQEEKFYPVRRGGKATDIPLVVLVNAGTASASEIVAGAIRDSDRGILVGESTFGKGSVQLVYDLSDESSLHVTVAHWFTPDRHEITGNGLAPDIVVPLTEEDRTQGKDPQLDRAIAYFKQTDS